VRRDMVKIAALRVVAPQARGLGSPNPSFTISCAVSRQNAAIKIGNRLIVLRCRFTDDLQPSRFTQTVLKPYPVAPAVPHGP
jgi:hypothetical protein